MQLIKQLARELAERDKRQGFDPASSIEELKTVLAGELLKEYAEVYHGLETAGEEPDPDQTRVVGEGTRATLALNLQRAAVGEINLTATFLRLCARAITGPTKRELELDEILHSSDMDVVLVFAEEAGRDAAPVAARAIRERRKRT